MEKGELKRIIVESADGSHTLHVPDLKEHYHSHKGAIQESQYVFLKMGFEEMTHLTELNILEVGFGTGLNALLTYFKSQPSQIVRYTALEAYPLPTDILDKLNYPVLIEEGDAIAVFEKIHLATWEEWQVLKPDFELKKVHAKLEDFSCGVQYDLVYYDAFAPHAQPELWEYTVFRKLFEMMAKDGVLVTYCAKGQVRRDLQAAGFKVERLPGPPGKREMLRARKVES